MGLQCHFNGVLLRFVLRLFSYIIFSISFLLVLLLLLKIAILCIGITWRDAFFSPGRDIRDGDNSTGVPVLDTAIPAGPHPPAGLHQQGVQRHVCT